MSIAIVFIGKARGTELWLARPALRAAHSLAVFPLPEERRTQAGVKHLVAVCGDVVV